LSLTVAETVTLPDPVAPLAGAVIATVGGVPALLLALTKPAHPALNNARLTNPISRSTCSVPTAPRDIRKSLIDLLKSFLSTAGEAPKGAAGTPTQLSG
jgi:hypothetical protein